jgi:hypothetical protein
LLERLARETGEPPPALRARIDPHPWLATPWDLFWRLRRRAVAGQPLSLRAIRDAADRAGDWTALIESLDDAWLDWMKERRQ